MRAFIILSLGLLAVAVGVACGGDEAAPAAAASQPTSQPASRPATAEAIVAALKAAGLPITGVQVYTAESDPNALLGRPGQYTGKANFTVDGIPEERRRTDRPFDIVNGGAVEVFSTVADLESRKTYLDAFRSLAPEYTIPHGTVLLRLSYALTPDQAATYEAALKALKL